MRWHRRPSLAASLTRLCFRGDAMDVANEFNAYMAYLMQGLGDSGWHSGLSSYCIGLMLPLSRKFVEPMAARVDPLHASAKRQPLHYFVAKAQRSDQESLRRVAQWVVPVMDFSADGWWIIDGTDLPKRGTPHADAVRGTTGLQSLRVGACRQCTSAGPRQRRPRDRAAVAPRFPGCCAIAGHAWRFSIPPRGRRCRPGRSVRRSIQRSIAWRVLLQPG